MTNPNILDILKLAAWKNSGCCYGTAFFENKDAAKALSAMVRMEGRTANGGWFDGMPLGAMDHIAPKDGKPELWSVTY